jgi:type I restriction enzyme S subunit
MVNWDRRRLGEVVTQVSRAESVDAAKEYRLLGVRLDGSGPFLREVKLGSQTAATTLYEVREGDFIYSRLFAWRGAFGVIGADMAGCYVSNEFPTFVPCQDSIDVQFLNLWFRLPSTLAAVEINCTGSTPLTRNRFKERFFVDMELPLPPLAEQRRIVARIAALAERIAEARGLRQEAVEEAEMLVASEVSKLFNDGSRNGWKHGKLTDYVIDDRYGTSERASDDSSGTAILRMGNIQNGHLDLRDLKYLHLSAKDRANLLLAKGDILVNRTNSAELVGKCAVFHHEGEFAFASYLIRLRLEATRADPWLIASYINSPAGRAYMFSERKQMTGQANVNATKLKALPISLPPLPEQRRIVAYLDGLQARVNAVKRLQAESAAELAALLPAVLDRAFKGEL